jgi:hypothetical protein
MKKYCSLRIFEEEDLEAIVVVVVVDCLLGDKDEI